MTNSMQLLVPACLLIQLSLIFLTNASALNANIDSAPADDIPLNLDQKDNYCLRNVTYYEDVSVSKTRQVEVKPTGVFKWFKKSKQQIEQYDDRERVPRTRLQNACCEGYAMAANKTCQPVCEPQCPANAFCRSPKMCQCRRGYDAIKAAHNGIHHCLPRCGSGCPYGGRCVAPELCECAPGFQATAGSCAPTCASDCLNGRCVALNKCNCNAGFAKNLATGECVPLADCDIVDCEDVFSSSSSVSSEMTTDDTTNTIEYETDATDIYDTGADSDNGTQLDETRNVDEGNVLFPSNEEDTNCTLQRCIGNTVCQLVGHCACADGFIRHQPAPVNGIEVGPICAAVVEQSEILADQSFAGGWVGALLIVVGATLMVGALVLLLIKLWRHQRGSLDVEGKTDMCCRFEKSTSGSDSDRGEIC